MVNKMKGAIAAGHELTARAGVEMLEQGGNAFDAAVAASFASFICEPALTSPGGGGFFMAHPKDSPTLLYDFFCDIPGEGLGLDKNNLEFYSVDIDFSDAIQKFHVGKGAAATPGCLKGLKEVFEKHCALPLKEILRPAISYAKTGIPLNKEQADFIHILTPILTCSEGSRNLFAPNGTVLKEGDIFINKDLADTFEYLSNEGLEKFYEGEFKERILKTFGKDGLVTSKDLDHYKVKTRTPLQMEYKDRKIYTNPPPSSGGALMAMSLKLIEPFKPGELSYNKSSYLKLLSKILKATDEARDEVFSKNLYKDNAAETILEKKNIEKYRNRVEYGAINSYVTGQRGTGNTTHISVIDKNGNAAAITASNGEGCGHLVPGTGIMLNNMLGEEDTNPYGFHGQQPGTRMSSMMSPTIVMKGKKPEIVLGSGGSKRIRSTILQALLNILEHKLPLFEAVNNPRAQWEDGIFHVEKGIDEETLHILEKEGIKLHKWNAKNTFFGGAHAVMMNDNGEFSGSGDLRRGGVCLYAE